MAAQKKHVDLDVDKLIAIDDARRELLETIRSKQKDLQDTSKEKERLKETMEKWQILMIEVPNIPDMSTPEGKTTKENRVERNWGDVPQFTFTPRTYARLTKDHDMVDTYNGETFLKNSGAVLLMALWQFVFDTMKGKEYMPVIAPSLVEKSAFIGIGSFPQKDEDFYITQDGMFLAHSSEASVLSHHMDKTIVTGELPKKYISFSHGFSRKNKKEDFVLEQIILSEANHMTSVSLHEEMTKDQEMIIQALGLPYRVVTYCGGLLGSKHVKKYSIEIYFPTSGKYREVCSSSYSHDFQARRLNIKYVDKQKVTRFVHSLHGSIVTGEGILQGIIENFQNEDGSIRIPKSLQKYVGVESLVIWNKNTEEGIAIEKTDRDTII